ncbi:MAG: sulfatase [Planctomycetota bacterium]|nr:sulfatase [Planctomycetota bacterium]MDA1139763.1 sulfatase [Planctomycetota bacterium]
MRVFLLTLVVLLPAVQAETKKTNFLFIAVDDLRPELNCYGRTQMITPNMDALAANGTLFMRNYCQQAVCSPSRTSLMTGLRPDSTKVYDLSTHFRDKVPDTITLPQHLIANGYHAEAYGKIYHGGYDDKRSWSVPAMATHQLGGKGYLNKQTEERLAALKKEAREKGLKGKAISNYARGPATEAADVSDEKYSDGGTTAAGIKALQKLSKGDKPFFLAVGLLKPHLPFTCPKKYWDMYDASKIKLADNPFAPKNVTPYSMHTFGELRSYSDMPQKGNVPAEDAKRLIHGYYACVSYVDALIGELVTEVERLRLMENTVIIVWGDHGWHLGDHNLWCKHSNFENATRSPMIVRAPGHKPGGKTLALTEFVDIYPTFCELAGVPLPGHLEGTSFVPLLSEPNRPWKKAAFSQYPRGGNNGVMGYSMRTNRYHYIEWQSRKDGSIQASELYDHDNDADENENIAGKPEQKELVARLSIMVKGGWKAAKP